MVPRLTTVFDRIDRIFSYRVALAYKPMPIGTFYVAYGTSFNPSAEGAVSLPPLTAATALLEPEENRTFEIGTKWDLLNERLALTAAIFRTDKTNARTPGLTPNDPPMVLDGEQRVQGFEIGAAGNITEHWKVFGGYTFLDSEILETNVFTVDPFTGALVSQEGNRTAADAGAFLQSLDRLRAAVADRDRRRRELCRRAFQLGRIICARRRITGSSTR